MSQTPSPSTPTPSITSVSRADVPPAVLFVCAHNAGRSQLAAGLAAARAGGSVTVLSAGTAPADTVNGAVLASLAELGIDRSDQVPQLITEDLVRRVDLVVALKPGLDIPKVDGVRYETWPLPDPAGWDVEAVRPLRTAMIAKIDDMLGGFGVSRTV